MNKFIFSLALEKVKARISEKKLLFHVKKKSSKYLLSTEQKEQNDLAQKNKVMANPDISYTPEELNITLISSPFSLFPGIWVS